MKTSGGSHGSNKFLPSPRVTPGGRAFPSGTFPQKFLFAALTVMVSHRGEDLVCRAYGVVGHLLAVKMMREAAWQPVGVTGRNVMEIECACLLEQDSQHSVRFEICSTISASEWVKRADPRAPR